MPCAVIKHAGMGRIREKCSNNPQVLYYITSHSKFFFSFIKYKCELVLCALIMHGRSLFVSHDEPLHMHGKTIVQKLPFLLTNAQLAGGSGTYRLVQV